MLHADEITDRIGTVTRWMHVVSTTTYTLIHASATSGLEAVRTAGVLIGYRGVIVHDRLALYWKLTTARQGICSAHNGARAVMRNGSAINRWFGATDSCGNESTPLDAAGQELPSFVPHCES